MNISSFITDTTRSLDRKVGADEVVSVEDVADTSKLARLLTRILKLLADVRRSFVPRRTDFEDKDVDASGTVRHRFAHGFGGRVRWWVVDSDAVPALVRHADTNANTLVLTSTVACRLTLRIEEAG